MKEDHTPINRQDGHSEQSNSRDNSANAVTPAIAKNQQPNSATTQGDTENQQKGSDKSELERQMVGWTATIGRWTKAVGIFTALLFVATAGSGVILFLTDRTLNHTIEVNKEIAANQLMSFDKESKIRLRAYALYLAQRNVFEVGKPLKATATLHILGQTPAYKIKGWAATAIIVHPLPKTIDLDALVRAEGTNIEFLTPGASTNLQLQTRENMSEESIGWVMKAKTHRVYIWGRTEYVDVFHCRHWIKFCQSFDDFSPSGLTTEACQDHNETDDAAICVPE